MKNKKAFTVVELVIVIAIIAILAAVLIPTFANIIKKANTSKDNQLIRNLNTALAASRAENNNEPHANMTEALAAAEKFGYEVDKINASGTDAEILWDSQNDLFCYFDGSEIKYIPESELIYTKNNTDPEKKIYDVDYWVIRKDVTNTAADNRGEGEHQISAMYSTYLAGLAGNDATIVITKGLDVGNNTISSIQYNNETAQRVSIRTNGGTLEVNAPNDTVNHFGDADSVNIIDVKSTSSYHEFGTVPFIQIKSGRLVLEKTADVNGIHLVVTGE
ncbi:MAG: prepilin-type N-terminal cleavage/methylation domain-containing protein, partial [Clostridia bacterium]|nr:prepilin-type N-terminal cleavage/methylation domain-containing protein [Clostridia bacterium]